MCTHFPDWLAAQRAATAADQVIIKAYLGLATIRRFDKVTVGGLKLGVGDWFLARRSRLTDAEQASLWFGHTVAAYKHIGPDDVERVVLQVMVSGGRGRSGR